VAAPVFSQIMRYALHRYDIPTSPGGGSTGGKAQPVPFPQVSPPPTVPSTRAPPTTLIASPGKTTEGP
jgi:hypothetical protein